MFINSRSYLALFSKEFIKLLTPYSIYSIKRLFRTADLMYAIPFYRATIYLLGILLGYVMQTYKDYRLSEVSVGLVSHECVY